MTEDDIRSLIRQVGAGRLSRRDFILTLAAVGIAAPMASMLLGQAGAAEAKGSFVYTPTKAGGGGTLKMLAWQAATQLNPHFASGSADQHAIYLFYEPLANWDGDGMLVPVLAAELPSVENGGISADGRSVTWKLKRDVLWHDGKPFTADDCLFTAAFAAAPETSAYTMGTYRNIKVAKIDDFTIRVEFPRATPFWADPFVGTRGLILPRHHFEAYPGPRAAEAPANLKPVGTGPFICDEFVAGDLVRAHANPHYHVPNRPYFDAVEIKGGGDEVSAARAVLQTGEYDFAWNLAVEDEVLDTLRKDGDGQLFLLPGANIEHIQLNMTDPNTEIGGERSSIESEHPAFRDNAVREAMSLLIDREAISKFVYGRSGEATANFIVAPERFVSKNTSWSFNIARANTLLDAAGWQRGPDGIRAKDGKRLSFVFSTTTSDQRQRTQQVVKQGCDAAGILLELKAVAGSIFFSSDPGNPDTAGHFYTDMQMYTSPMREPDPGTFMQQFLSSEVSKKDNKWQGRNVTRYRSAEFDRLYEAASVELDPARRAALFIEMNDLVVKDIVVIPLIFRKVAAGARKGLRAPLSTWSSYMWRISDWYIET